MNRNKIRKMNSKASDTKFMTKIIKIVVYRSCLKANMQKKSLILQNNSDYMAEIDTLMKDSAVSGGVSDAQSIPSASAEPANIEPALPMANSQERSGADSVQSVLEKKEKSAPAKPEVTLQMAIDAATQNLEIDAPRKKKRQTQSVQAEAQPTAALNSDSVKDSLSAGFVLENSPLRQAPEGGEGMATYADWANSLSSLSRFDSIGRVMDSIRRKDSQSVSLTDVSAVKPVTEKRIETAELKKDGDARHEALYSQIWFVPMMFILFFLFGLMYSNQKKQLEVEFKELFRLNRLNLSVSNTQTSFSRFVLTLLSLVSVSVFVYLAYAELIGTKSGSCFLGLAATFGLVSAFFILKDMMSALLGYVFFSREHTWVWMRSYNYILVLLGLALFPVNLCISFSPMPVAFVAVWLGIFIVILSALLFLYKLNALFFSGAFSIFYLILYLCTLEILPVSALIFGVGSIIGKV